LWYGAGYNFKNWWIYLSPFLGGIGAGVLWQFYICAEDKPSEEVVFTHPNEDMTESDAEYKRIMEISTL
jgi:hypothetical protein